MSDKSAHRLVFDLDNAPNTFDVMATLTFRERVTDGRPELKRFQKNLNKFGLNGMEYAWVREYQQRGAVHYHWMMASMDLWKRGLWEPQDFRNVGSGTKQRLIVGGRLERILVASWMDAVGDCSDEFEAFQRGGIVEVIAAESGCAAYFGSYLGKKTQKEVPADAEVNGRWWFVSKSAKKIPYSLGHLAAWDKEFPLTRVFDKRSLEGAIVRKKQKACHLPISGFKYPYDNTKKKPESDRNL